MRRIGARDRRQAGIAAVVAAMAVVGAAMVGLSPAPAGAVPGAGRAADVDCDIERVTPDGTTITGDNISASADGTRMVFETGASSIAILDTVADTVELVGNAREPAISGNGLYVVYRDAARAVWRRTFESPGTPALISSDLTQSGDVGPAISNNGGFVAFRSLGHPATDTGFGIWRWKSNNTLIPAFDSNDDTAEVSVPVISSDGGTIAFSSDANISGGNPDRNVEAFRYSASVAQITHSARDNHVQGVNGDGTVFPINSQANWVGLNGDANTELFVFDLSPPPVTIEQVSFTASPAVGALEGTVDTAGSGVVFTSTRDLLVTGDPTAEELYFHRVGVALHRLTDVGTSGAGSLGVPDISGDGTSVLVGSTRNFGGLNPTNASHVFRFTCAIPSFKDVPASHPFFDEIEWLAGSGIAGGYPDGTFKPNSAVSRQAMAAFLYRMSGSPSFTPPVTPTFTDVPTSHAFYSEIEWLADSGIAGGFPDGSFKPTASVSRQAMGAFLYRMAESPAFTPPGTPSFDDVPLDHTFFLEIEWLSAEDIAGGFADGGYHPGAAVSRQAMAAFLFRLDPLLPD